DVQWMIVAACRAALRAVVSDISGWDVNDAGVLATGLTRAKSRKQRLKTGRRFEALTSHWLRWLTHHSPPPLACRSTGPPPRAWAATGRPIRDHKPFQFQKAIATSPFLPFVTNSRQISTLPAVQPPVYG